VECSNSNSQPSARCHLSEMDLTRQRRVTFPREEMLEAYGRGWKARPRSGKRNAGVLFSHC
jgi:hypothetical protein